FAWHALTWRSRPGGSRASAIALAACIGVSWIALIAAEIYQRVAMMPFSVKVALASPSDSYRTVVQVIGEQGLAWGLAAVVGAAVAASLAARFLLRAVLRWSQKVSPGRTATIVCAGILAYFMAGDIRHVVLEFTSPSDSHYPLHAPDYAKLPVHSSE